MCEIRANHQTKHANKVPNNLHMEMTNKGEMQPPKSMIFAYPPTRNRSFNFSTFVESVLQKTQSPSKLRPAGAFGATNW